MLEAKVHIKAKYMEHKDESDLEKIAGLIKFANQTEIILRRNIVQAWERKDSPGTYVLNLTDDKEINDNESIKSKKGQPAQDIGKRRKCCN
ncbi:hypothetical protein BC833DRAFT_613045, partial [Globomyces pollinis-pini]